MKVAILGVGLMGAQIGCEYALGGHHVTFVARTPAKAHERIAATWALVERAGQASTDEVTAARARTAMVAEPAALDPATEVVVESVVEDLATKGQVLAAAGAVAAGAILATNTSALPIGAVGTAAGAPDRTIGTHYANPPLLMPLVEVIRSQQTRPDVVETMTALLRSLGKRPIAVERDVPGFVWNRLQLALLREAVWIVEQAVATPAAVDEAVRDMLARRWRYTGPFETAALGGAATFEAIAANLWPVLSAATTLTELRRWLPRDDVELTRLRERRDLGLLADLRADNGVPAEGGPRE